VCCKKKPFIYLSYACEMFCPLEASTVLKVSVWLRLIVLLVERLSDGLCRPKCVGGEENKLLTLLAALCVRGCCMLIIRTLYYVAIRQINK
jgi:hypothetical protein